jgi:hypothetical protein
MPQGFAWCKPLSAPLDARPDSGQNSPMSDSERPTLTDKGKRDADERAKRQAEALRANLARRKAQARARQDQEPPPPKAGES